MLYIAGVILIIIGIVQIVKTFFKSRKNKIEGVIEEITMEYQENDKQKIKKFPHGLIRYTYRSNNFTAKVFLLKKNPQVGDRVFLVPKNEEGTQVVMYALKQEVLTGVFMIGVGIAIVAVSTFIMKWLA